MTARVQCCVPFCTRSTKNRWGFSEWVCPAHWRLVPRRIRHLHHRVRRRLRKRPTAMVLNLDRMVWDRCKRAAIEAAAGLA